MAAITAAAAAQLRCEPAAARAQTRLAATKGFNFDVASWLRAHHTIHEDVKRVKTAY